MANDKNFKVKNGLDVGGSVTLTGSSALIFDTNQQGLGGELGLRGSGEAFQIFEPEESNKVWLQINDDPTNSNTAFQINSTAGMSPVFHDQYHPNADKWTTARTNTVTLTGAVTGSGSASVDGSGNWTVSVPTTVNHTHNYDNYVSWTAKDHDGTTYTVTSGDTLWFKEGSAIDVNFTADDELTISHADTSSQSSVNNSNGVVIQDVTLDGHGHVTGLASVDLDGRYALISHKYHSFSNGQYFHDNYEQGNNFRLFTENYKSDNIRHGAISNVEYYNGSAWVAWSGGDSAIQNILDGNENSGTNIDHTHRQFRFVVQASTGYPTGALFFLQTTWTAISYPGITVTIEDSTSATGTFTQRDSAVFTSANTGNNWGIHAKYMSTLHNGASFYRFTVDITDWTDYNSNYTTIPLRRIALLSNYSGDNIDPYSVAYDKRMNLEGGLTANGSIHSPIFYDKDNTGYYIDANNESNISRLIVNGGNDNDNKADLSVGCGGNPQISLYGNSVNMGSTDMNWSSKLYYASGTFLGAWDNQITVFVQGGTTDRNIVFRPSLAGTSTTRLTVTPSAGVQASQDMRAPVFYDLDNTAYFVNPTNTSNINILNVADINRDPTVTLSGDVTGSATMTNLGSINITTTVANDSHTHSNYILSNADDSYSGAITATGIGWYLWSLGARGASAGQYGIGNRNDDSYRQLTFHIPNLAAYSNTGTVPSFGWYSNGAQQLMKLESATAKLSLYTGSINLGYDIGTTTNSIGASNWFRSSGNTGWYNGTHGGGIYMTDTTWVRTYNNKAFLSENTIQSNNNVRAPIFYDSNNTSFYIDPASTSNINILNVADINRDPTVTLSGDVTGSATMTNLGSINITTTVGNDSHSHSNYMLKYNGASTADYDTLTTNGVWRNQGGANGPFGTAHATGFTALQSDTNYGWQLASVSQNQIALRFKGTTWSSWSNIFNDGYHPNADKWTTARTNTVTLTGSVTGTGSASVDGSGNWTVTVPTTTNHTHNYDNYGSWTAEDGDGTQYTVTSGDVLKFAEGSGINVNFSADDVLRIEYKGNEIPGSVDLNTYRTTGFYAQNANADAASGSNYPTANAGILQVINDDYGNGLHTTQLYSQYNSTNYYHRTYYNGTWSSWRNLAQDTTYTVGNGSMTVTAGSGLTGGGQLGTANQTGNTSITVSHADTSSQASVNNSNGTVIQDITLDTYGHITAIGSVNLDGRYQLIAAPAAPTITNTTLSGETVEIVFSQSATSGVNGYEIWSDGGGVSFALIGRIPETDIAASMSFVDTTFTDTGTINYHVYAIRNGVYSTAATTTATFSVPSLDVANFAAIPDLNAFHLQYDLPVTRFLDHIEIYLDTNAASGSLARANASLIYSGDNPSYTYNISASDRDNYHQFWVECVGVA